jgi:hypothetical protein
MDRQGEKSYFGICFTPAFPLKVEDCHQLALFLFANPFTSFRETRNIINNISAFPSIQHILNSLNQQLSKVLITSDKNETLLLDAFNTKFNIWFSYYSFPVFSEIKEVTEILKIPPILFLNILLEALISNDLGVEKMIDFLSKFGSILNEHEIDKILDSFILKNDNYQFTNNSKNGIQIQLFNSI